MKFKIEYPVKEDFLIMEKYALEEFGIPDKDMVAPTLKNDLSIQKLEKNNFICYKKNGKPIAWSVALPTSRKIENKFLKKEISENNLFNESLKKPTFESLYLFAVIVLSEYRQGGLAKELMNYQIKYFKDKYGITNFFAWIFSREGELLVKSLERDNLVDINYISRI